MGRSRIQNTLIPSQRPDGCRRCTFQGRVDFRTLDQLRGWDRRERLGFRELDHLIRYRQTQHHRAAITDQACVYAGQYICCLRIRLNRVIWKI